MKSKRNWRGQPVRPWPVVEGQPVRPYALPENPEGDAAELAFMAEREARLREQDRTRFSRVLAAAGPPRTWTAFGGALAVYYRSRRTVGLVLRGRRRRIELWSTRK